MDEMRFKCTTRQPLIAERQLLRVGSQEHATVRIYQPELGNMTLGMPWRCGYSIVGLPGLPKFYGPEMELADDEVWFSDGEDSFNALVVAFANIRALVDRVEEEFDCVYAWLPRERFGHLLPAMVTQTYGREHERLLLEAMQRASDQILRELKSSRKK